MREELENCSFRAFRLIKSTDWEKDIGKKSTAKLLYPN